MNASRDAHPMGQFRTLPPELFQKVFFNLDPFSASLLSRTSWAMMEAYHDALDAMTPENGWVPPDMPSARSHVMERCMLPSERTAFAIQMTLKTIAFFVQRPALAEWAVANGAKPGKWWFRWSVWWGKLDTLKWLRENVWKSWDGIADSNDDDDDDMLRNPCAAAARQGHLHVLQWLTEDEDGPWIPMDETVVKHAANHGSLDMLRWMQGRGCDFSEHASGGDGRVAARVRLSTMDLEPTDANAARSLRLLAAMAGELSLLERLCEKFDGMINDDSLLCAVIGGNQECLEFIRRRGARWDANLCVNAVIFGRLETLQWLRANGCPWDKSVWIEAVRYGHTDMLRWAIANGCPISDVELETLRRRTGESLVVDPR